MDPADEAQTFAACLQRRAASQESSLVCAVIWSLSYGIQERLTYRDFEHRTRRRASAFLSRGVLASDRTAMLAKGDVQFFVAIVALQWMGAVPVLLNWRHPTATVVGMFQDARCRCLVVGAAFAATPQAEALRSLAEVVVTTDLDDSDLTVDTIPAVPFSGDSEALILFTSGSTGKPKAVVHSHNSLMWTARRLPMPAGDKRPTLCFLPNFHVLMTIQNFLCPVARGVAATIAADPEVPMSASLLLAACRDVEPSTIDTVPFVLEELAAGNFAAEDIAVIAKAAVVRSGGASLSADACRRLLATGLPIRIHYGQTEAPGMQLLSVPTAAADELGVLAPPWADVQAEVDDRTGELILVGVGGSSPGYLDPETGALVPGRSFHGRHATGDVFEKSTTRAGQTGVVFCRRLDDAIVLTTGELVDPVAYEATFAKALDVPTSSVILLGSNLARPVAVVEVDKRCNRRRPTRAELRRALECANKTAAADYARPSRCLLLDRDNGDPQLPRNVKGAIVRVKAEAVLRTRLDNDDDDDSKANDDISAMAALKRRVATYLAQGRNAADLTMLIPGLDSLTAIKLVSDWRRMVKIKKSKHLGRLEQLKAWLSTYRAPAGRSLFSILRNEFATRWYTFFGYYDGMKCTFDFGMPPIRQVGVDDAGRHVQQSVFTSVVFEDGRELRVRIWHDEPWDRGNDGDESSKSRRPCILAVSGDAFFGCAETLPIPWRLVKCGYCIAQADRRGSHEGGIFPAALHDLSAAVRALKGHASSFHIDPDRICVMGDSSGGWFAAMLGALSGYEADPIRRHDLLGSLGDFPHLSNDVRCACCFFPPIRFNVLDKGIANENFWLFAEPHDDVHAPTSMFMGHGLQHRPDRIEMANPTNYITANTCPFWVTHGTVDPSIPASQSRDFVRALKTARSQDLSDNASYHQFIEVAGAGHGTYHFTDKSYGIEANLLNFLDRWLEPPSAIRDI